MNKTELIDAMAAETGMIKEDCKKALEGVTVSIEKALKAGDKVALMGFGTFGVTERAARTGRNPKTGAPLEIAAKKLVVFKAGKELESTITN
jgi:DNA-binding protein HU-beta